MKLLSDASTRGILYADSGKKKFRLTRYEPTEALQPYIEQYWVTEWDLRGEAPYRQIVLAHPNINMVNMLGNTRIYGISPTTSSQLLEGQGRALGVKFQPAGFYPFWKQPVSKLTSRSLDFREVFEQNVQFLEVDILANGDEEEQVLLLERFFLERIPMQDRNVPLLNGMVHTIMNEPEILRVDDLVNRFGIHMRTLQRLFNRYVGMSPKWVIQRYRLHEAADRMEREGFTDWSRLSLELGYYDQAHFIKTSKP
jgi:AraC-like DNA-binding protein